MTEKVRRILRLPNLSQRLLTFIAVVVCFIVVHLLLNYTPFSMESSSMALLPLPSTESPSLRKQWTKTSVPDLNWTTCPSENELRERQHYRNWDEKLAQQLRVSIQTVLKIQNESWYAVTPDIHVFSAFLVTTEWHAIHIISLVRGRLRRSGFYNAHTPLVCLVRSSTGTAEYPARIKIVWTWNNPPFKNAFILCQPPEDRTFADGKTEVAVTVQGVRTKSLRWIPLRIPSDHPEDKCCAVCIRPIFGSSMSLWKLVEFVAHYRLLGARSFYFYDMQITADVKRLLSKLQAAGVDITVVKFPLLVKSSDVHAQGQMPGLYDCIFRSMSKKEYFINVDLDELLMPVRNFSISAIIEDTERKHGKNAVGSILMKMRYNCVEYPINSHYWNNKRVPLRTVTFPYRSIVLHECSFTKYIGRSRAICNAAVHAVLTHCGRAREKQVDASVAVINHYRRCCAFTPEDEAIKQRVPLWDVSHVTFDEPFDEYLPAVESDLAIMTMRSLLTDI